MSHIFISYSRTDQTYASRLKIYLQELALGSREGRVLRGGSFDYFDKDAKVFFRLNSFPDFRFDNIGFRVCSSVLNP